MLRSTIIILLSLFCSFVNKTPVNSGPSGYVLIDRPTFGCSHIKKIDSNYIDVEDDCAEEKKLYYYMERRIDHKNQNFKFITLTHNRCKEICIENMTKEKANDHFRVQFGYNLYPNDEYNTEISVLRFNCIRKEVEEKMFDYSDMEYLSSCVISGDSHPSQCTPFWKFWEKDFCECAYRIKANMPGKKIKDLINHMKYYGECREDNLIKELKKGK